MPRFKKISADEARAKRNDHVRSGAGGEVLVKGFKAPPSWNKEQRSARFIMTSESVDRYGDIVVQAGLDIARFLENPQGLLFHNSRSWPAGNWSDVTKVLSGRPKRTEGTFNFLPEGTDEDADRAARHVAAGSIRTVSIGFAPDWDEVELILDDEEEWVTGLKFNASEMLECSLVPIPAQPDALVKDAGGDFRLARDLIEEVLDTYAKTPEGLLVPMSAYEKAYKTVVEKIAADEIAPPGAGPTAEEVDTFVAKAIETDASLEENDAGFKAHAGGQIVAELKTGLAGVSLHLDVMKRVEDGKAAKGAPELTDEVINAFAKGLVDADAAGDSKFSVDLWDAGGPHLKVAEKALPLPAGTTMEQAKAIVGKVRSAFVALKHSSVATDPEENKTGTAGSVVVTVSADTSAIEAAATKVEGIFTRLAKQFPMFFPKAVEERIEPTIVPPEPPAPPSAEAITAAAAKAAAVRERLASKGLIAA